MKESNPSAESSALLSDENNDLLTQEDPLESYEQKRRYIISKKLQHPFTATCQSLIQIDMMFKYGAVDEECRVIKTEIEAYEQKWRAIIERGNLEKLTDPELDELEDQFSQLPQIIAKFYEPLLKHDGDLSDLLEQTL